MDINLKSLSIRRNESTVAIAMVDNEDRKSDVYMLTEEVERIVQGARVAIDDCSQFMIVGTNGARVVRLNSYCESTIKAHGTYTDIWYTFPTNELYSGLSTLLLPDSIGEMIDYTDQIDAWKGTYGPKVAWNWNKGVYDTYFQDIRHDLVNAKDQPDFTASLLRIASNHSDGQLVTIYMSFDCYHNPAGAPHNYYFDIIADDGNIRIMNGGIIAHEERGKYVYSMRT